ncbi:hypothetical protein CABS01_09399, partial [Colletotrichum abscissum]|uniref:uncharacterized protein n=1 Tax=Colletotrichum abscissum TaxID=1671311 RepID=UPI0027D67865
TLVRLAGAETVSLSRNFRCPRHGKRRTNVKKPQGCGTSGSSARRRKAKTFGKVGSRRCMCTFYNGEQIGNFLIFTSRCSFPSVSSGERTRMEQNGVRVCVCVRIHTSYG